MLFIIFAIVIFVIIMLFMGAWRLGGGISDWIDNEEDKKKHGKK